MMNCFGCGKKTKNISGWCEECYDEDDGDSYDEESGPEINHPNEVEWLNDWLQKDKNKHSDFAIKILEDWNK